MSFIVEAIPLPFVNNTAKMTLTLTPKPTQSHFEYCANITNLCFWNTASYKISESNANDSQVIGALGPDFNALFCPGYKINYNLLNGEFVKFDFPCFVYTFFLFCICSYRFTDGSQKHCVYENACRS